MVFLDATCDFYVALETSHVLDKTCISNKKKRFEITGILKRRYCGAVIFIITEA